MLKKFSDTGKGTLVEDCPCKGPGAETFLLGSIGEKSKQMMP